MSDFYERLTPFFHMIYADWDATITAHGDMLDDIICSQWGAAHKSHPRLVTLIYSVFAEYGR